MTALQDWLNIRPFDPRSQVKAVISALRGETTEDASDVDVEHVLIRPGIERC
ncbi:hypothetical protein [Mycolicibacterium stellerae]|uniref:hypothetical protein n=1 Tax=Mycolicibacterium stellerae TaxID=2358193 RepID=UPI0013DE72DC|nr:hypothetical protein [Mycolicibacterium stellerae]